MRKGRLFRSVEKKVLTIWLACGFQTAISGEWNICKEVQNNNTCELSEYFEEECEEEEYEEEECVREVQEKPTKTNPKSVKHENVPKVKTIENPVFYIIVFALIVLFIFLLTAFV